MNQVLIFYVGTHRLSLLLAEVLPESKSSRILSSAELLEPDGFQKGGVSELEKALISTGELIRRLGVSDDLSRIPAYVLLSNPHLKTTCFSSSIYYTGYPRVITSREVQKIINQTRSVAPLPLEEWILQTVPDSFWVDDLTGVENPIGLEARRLAVSLKIYSTPYSIFRNLARLFESLELNLQGYVPKTLILPEGVLQANEREGEALVVDFSDAATHLVLTSEGRTLQAKSLEIGSRFLTARIAQTWKVSLREGERLKERFGSLEENLQFREELIPLVERNGEAHHPIKREDFHREFSRFAEELFGILEPEIRRVLGEEKKPHPTLVLTGGGVKLEGLLEFVSRRFSFPVRLGTPRQMEGGGAILTDPAWTGPLGLLRWLEEASSHNTRVPLKENFMERALLQFKEWLVAYF